MPKKKPRSSWIQKLIDYEAGKGTPAELSKYAAWKAKRERERAENPAHQAWIQELQDDLRKFHECRRQAKEFVEALDKLLDGEGEQYLIDHPPSPKAILGLFDVLPALERKERAAGAAIRKHGVQERQEKEVRNWVIIQWQEAVKRDPELKKIEFAKRIIPIIEDEFDDFKGKLSIRTIAYSWLKNW